MTVQAKREPLEFLHLQDVTGVINTYTSLYGMGYRGILDTVGNETARLDMSLPDNVPVTAAVGDVILYRTSPAIQVVACISYDELVADYEAVA